MTAATFVRAEAIDDGYLYSTPAGRYFITNEVTGWVLATPGGPVGQFETLEAAEAALNTDVLERMWA